MSKEHLLLFARAGLVCVTPPSVCALLCFFHDKLVHRGSAYDFCVAAKGRSRENVETVVATTRKMQKRENHEVGKTVF